jgi:cytochrome b561
VIEARTEIRAPYPERERVAFLALAGTLVLGRLWRATHGRQLPPLNHGVLHLAAVATHRLLDLLLVAIVALGIANVFALGFPLFNYGTFRNSAENSCEASMHGTG